MEFQELLKYKIFVSSSNFEGNPKGILEAMASGCVVIAKDNINISEIIEIASKAEPKMITLFKELIKTL